jgi:TonB family protein
MAGFLRKNSMAVAFFASAFAHAAAIFPWQGFTANKPERFEQKIEVAYIINDGNSRLNPENILIKKSAVKTGQKTEIIRGKSDAVRNAIEKTLSEQTTREISEINPASSRREKKTASDNTETVSIPEGLSEEEGVAYLDYYQSIRELIKAHLSNKYDKRFGEGQVNINFRLRSDGNLLSVNLLKSQNVNNSLKRITLQGVRTASPFPPFPNTLNLKELTFNVVISFKVQ